MNARNESAQSQTFLVYFHIFFTHTHTYDICIPYLFSYINTYEKPLGYEELRCSAKLYFPMFKESYFPSEIFYCKAHICSVS